MSKVILFFTITTTLFFASTWIEFKDVNGKFRVLVPGEMTEKTTPIETEMGKVAYHQFYYRSPEKDAENVYYVVNYCDYPKGAFPSDSTALISDFLNETVSASAKSIKGELIYVDDILLGGNANFKGKIWRVQYNNNRALIKSKCFLAGDRFYLVQAITVKAMTLNSAADKFLDSFQVL